MDQAWIDDRINKIKSKAQEKINSYFKTLEDTDVFDEIQKKIIRNMIDTELQEMNSSEFYFSSGYFFAQRVMRELFGKNYWKRDDLDNQETFIREDMNIEHLWESVRRSKTSYLVEYLDTEPIHFEGDLIITDPCYITKDLNRSSEPKWQDFHKYPSMRDYPDYDAKKDHSDMFSEEYIKFNRACDEWNESHPSDWETCNYGMYMDKLGIIHFMSHNTLYGDWGCTTYDVTNKDHPKAIGQFCADAGMVIVADLKEVLEYNPEFKKELGRFTCTTVKDFKGEVYFKIDYEHGFYEDETEYHKKGEMWEDFSLHVVGEGTNMKTGEPFKFYTSQTSL